MNKTLAQIQVALDDALGEHKSITTKTHLTKDDILDSLDSAVFLLNLETEFQKKLPEEAVQQLDLYLIENLINYLEQ